MLLHKVFTNNILEVEIILSVTDSLGILLERIILITGDQYIHNDLFAIRAFHVMHLEPLSQNAVPTDHVVATFANGIVYNVFHTDAALFIHTALHFIFRVPVSLFITTD